MIRIARILVNIVIIVIIVIRMTVTITVMIAITWGTRGQVAQHSFRGRD